MISWSLQAIHRYIAPTRVSRAQDKVVRGSRTVNVVEDLDLHLESTVRAGINTVIVIVIQVRDVHALDIEKVSVWLVCLLPNNHRL